VTCNPFGTLYNPLSIANAIQTSAVSHQPSVVFYDGLWHSMAHHGSFSRATKEEAEKAVAESVETMQRALEEATVVIVTFGTAWVYEMNGKVVGNCHKLPEKNFTRRRLSVEEIVAAWQPILAQYPDKKWLFTVSPIRHIRDGLHENQLSKATLLMAVEAIRNQYSAISYFPSYEILLDELRDYRFFADDLVHPSTLAVEYIWERFCETFCTSQTINAMRIAHKEWKFAHHRPLHEA
jgi:nucleoid DNA-binding protein